MKFVERVLFWFVFAAMQIIKIPISIVSFVAIAVDAGLSLLVGRFVEVYGDESDREAVLTAYGINASAHFHLAELFYNIAGIGEEES